jgi:hypothetical protein
MAKQAKQVEVEITDKMATKFVGDILERFERIESARGTYMNAARREREAMNTIYEGLAARGVPQKAAKIEIKIVMALEKIKGWMQDLEVEDRKMVQRLAKAMNDKKQLLLFGELPPEPKPAKKAKKAKAEPASNVVQMPTAPETQPAA